MITGILITVNQSARVLDPILGMAIACVIMWSAMRLVRDTTDVLLESTPKGIVALEVCNAMREVEGVVDVHDLHVWSLTTGFPALSAHITVDSKRLEDPDSVLYDLKQLLGERFEIHHTTLQIESVRYEHVEMVHR